MSSVDQERDLIRLYFLGELTEEERERLEQQFLTDPDYQEEVLMVEEELIEDYVGDSLSVAEKESFGSHLLSTPKQRQRLEIARALDRYCAEHPIRNFLEADSQSSNTGGADGEGKEPHDSPIPVIHSPSLFTRPVVAYSLAAVVLVAVVVGAWLLSNKWRRPDVGREFVLLNSKQGGSQKADLNVRLLPGAPRGGASLESIPHTQTGITELLLVLPPEEHSSYRVSMRGGNIPGEVSVSDLQPTVSTDGRELPVRIQPTKLVPGDYFLELSGLTPAGTFESLIDYRFRISN